MILSSLPEIETLHLADVTLPQGHPLAGQDCVVFAFLIRHSEGAVLVDTGVGGGHPGIEQLYRPVRRPLTDALAAAGVQPTDIAVVINTHLHFDHCGENRLFRRRPIYVQAQEYRAAQGPHYTVHEWVDAPGLGYELLDGEKEVVPGVSVVPTPGHTPGHQSILVESKEGRVIIAGQAAYRAEEFAGSEPAQAEGGAGAWDAKQYVESLRRLRALAPRRVYFSHDAAVWEQAGGEEE